MDKKKILIVEDDEDISMIEELYLQTSGYETKVINSGKFIENEIKNNDYSLIILDLMLPDKNGFEICSEIREMVECPILMVTARTDIKDKIQGFGAGADDYISKPFDPLEFVARVNANIRQSERRENKLKAANNGEIIINDLKILPDNWKVYKSGKELKLPHKEFELLRFLALNPNIVFSKEYLLEKIWGYDGVGDTATVMVHINRLREKIENDSKNPEILETVWGAGYRLNK